MNGLAKSIADNLVFFLEFLGIVVLIFVGKSKHVGPAMLGKPFNREMRT